MNNENPKTFENHFLTINVLFFTLFAAQTIYFIVGIFLIQTNNAIGMDGFNTIFMLVTPLVVLSTIFASKFIYTKQVSEFDKSLSLEKKLVSYRTSNIIKLALLEGANFFSISIMIITTNYFFAALFIIIIVLFFFNRPSKEKFIMDYEVSADDVIKII
ncbi:MAG: hypothetical protein IPJ23_15850 [Ignavibacteriales bacterium]|nr:hypothetical protein [Ignavibacteriales bacterium]